MCLTFKFQLIEYLVVQHIVFEYRTGDIITIGFNYKTPEKQTSGKLIVNKHVIFSVLKFVI